MYLRIFFVLLFGLMMCAGCGKTKSTDELIGDLKSSQERDRIIAVRLLPQRTVDSAKIVPAMIECLKEKAERDRDARVRRAAGIALSRIDPKLAPKSDQSKLRPGVSPSKGRTGFRPGKAIEG